MLVYGPGQFFAPHQDSEKTDDMIGTLVVTLPSAFRGGELVVDHHGEKITCRGPRDGLSFVAFYADCHHEVRPVRRGYRVALTYDLLLDRRTDPAAPANAAQAEALARCLRRHFETPRPLRWKGDRRTGPPDRLVYLLDYQYTRKSLGWNRLKGADGVRAALLREAAARAGCEVLGAEHRLQQRRTRLTGRPPNVLSERGAPHFPERCGEAGPRLTITIER